MIGKIQIFVISSKLGELKARKDKANGKDSFITTRL